MTLKYSGFFSCIALIASCVCLPLAAEISVKPLPTQLESCERGECIDHFKEYKTLARYGHSDAMYTLAEMYRLGHGTQVDMERSTKWYRRAAKLGNPFAQYKAAILYLQDGENRDIDKAMRYLRDANRGDLNEAAHLLGMLYIEGELVEKDKEKAKAYLIKAYEAGHEPTLNLLAEASEVALEVKRQAEVQPVKETARQAPTDDMEVIEVRAPSIEEVFSYHIATMRGGVPDAVSGTGTSLRGRTCGEMISCNSQSDRERIRDFLMSTW
ncbi:tetratricopeptide repeat protein [Shewanella marisflavi]|uniref:Sel1 repeat family protein n=1 Tax=Shewanella marisflavi TaxID=260364 RepID=A0AAC9XPU3_9GAMM|nr:tetratricopeptide repeat protein [Shewanella marisflavi]ASJ98451.1 hypothetical protein CFF01_18675 [Shewanella marisflavi]